MTKELTDEEVALALGFDGPEEIWPLLDGSFSAGWRRPREGRWKKVPVFTTSLDVIVGEIERRGLLWEVKRTSRCRYSAQLRDPYVLPSPNLERADTAPPALCKALVEYMRKKQ